MNDRKQYSTSEEAAIAHPEISIRLNSGNHEGGLQVELLIATQALQEMELIKERNSLPDMRDPYLMEDDSQTRRPLSRSRERSGSKSDRRKYSVGDSSTSQRQSGKSPTANDDGMNTHKDHAKYRGDENAKNGLEITGIVGSVKPKDCRNYMEENYGPVHFLWMTRLKKFTYVIVRRSAGC